MSKFKVGDRVLIVKGSRGIPAELPGKNGTIVSLPFNENENNPYEVSVEYEAGRNIGKMLYFDEMKPVIDPAGERQERIEFLEHTLKVAHEQIIALQTTNDRLAQDVARLNNQLDLIRELWVLRKQMIGEL